MFRIDRLARHIAAACLAAIIALPSFILSVPAGYLSAEAAFETSEAAVSHIGAGWNLGNTLDSYGTWISGDSPASYETVWGNPVTTFEMIDFVKAQGFNAIRIPVTWSQHIDASGNIDEAWLARVKEVVDYAYNDGLYVILNVHHDTGENGGDKVSWIIAENDNYSNNQARFAGLWTNIANSFESYGDRLIFEGYNEMLDAENTWNAPTSPDSYQAVNSYAQLFVDTVRATGGNNAQRNLMVNTYVASYDSAVLDAFVLPDDPAGDHLICSVHVYAPWGFTGTSSSVTWTSVHNDFGDSDKTEIENVMNALDAFSQRISCPLIIGEYGAEYKNNDDAIAQYAAYLVSAASSRGIKTFYWDNGAYGTGDQEGGYAIFDRSSLSWKTAIAQAITSSAAVVPREEGDEESNPSDITAETTAAETPETLETSETEVEETTAAIASEAVAATTPTTSAETSISSDIAETTEITTGSETENVVDPDPGSKSSDLPTGVLIAGGAALLALIYTGLFFLGRRNGRGRR